MKTRIENIALLKIQIKKGEKLFLKEKYKKAVKCFYEAERLNKKTYLIEKDDFHIKKNIVLHKNIHLCAVSFFDKEDLKSALKAFKFCIANYEYNKIENYTYIGKIYAKQNKKGKSLDAFEKAEAIKELREYYKKHLEK